jgi:hypothetical protein
MSGRAFHTAMYRGFSYMELYSRGRKRSHSKCDRPFGVQGFESLQLRVKNRLFSDGLFFFCKSVGVLNRLHFFVSAGTCRLRAGYRHAIIFFNMRKSANRCLTGNSCTSSCSDKVSRKCGQKARFRSLAAYENRRKRLLCAKPRLSARSVRQVRVRRS